MNRKMAKFVVENVKNDTTVLDIGFADGDILKQCLKKSNSKFYGIDISPDMVRLASQKNRQAMKKGRLVLRTASAEHMSFERPFGQIYTSNTVYFWVDPVVTLQKIYENLERGGEFLNLFRNKEWLDKNSFTIYGFAKYTEQELVDMTARAGFETELIPICAGTFCIRATKPL